MVSVILPAYNRVRTIVAAVESVLKQTERDLEVIVVDDASTDGTDQAVAALKDARVRLIRLSENGGACHARNVGIQAARGEFIAFQDSDDLWHRDKLARQLAFLGETGADAVFCAMERVDGEEKRVFPAEAIEGRVTQERFLWESLASTQCILGRAEVFRSCPFDEAMPRLQDWELMLRVSQDFIVRFDPSPLVDVYVQPDSLSRQPRKLLTALKRIYRLYHQEINAVCPVRWVQNLVLAARECGEEPWNEATLSCTPEWVYQPGQAKGHVLVTDRGLTSPDFPGTVLTLDIGDMEGLGERKRFLPRRLLPEVLRSDALSVRFAPEEMGETPQSLDERVQAALRGIPEEAEAWRVVSEAFGAVDAAAGLAGAFHMEMPRFARALSGIRQEVRTGPVRRIGAYYHNLRGGGVQRVMAALARVWADMGLDVTLITSRQQEADEYPVPDSAHRVMIPPFDPFSAENRMAHVRALAEAARGLDLLVDHAWADPMLLFDVLAVRSTGCRVLMHTHSVFSMTLLTRETRDRFQCMPDVYALADGVVALSGVDETYWSQCARRVFRTVNPLSFDVCEARPSSLTGHQILWVGRLSEEKRPRDAIDVMKRVVEQVPEATMTMLGDGNAAELLAYRDACGLRERIALPGYREDPSPWFEEADVFLCTSAYEGFGLTLAEAMGRGVPVVTYNMPYLETLGGGGHVSVPMGDTVAAARAVAALLKDESLRRKIGAAGRKHAAEHLAINQKAKWRQILDEMAGECPCAPVDSDTARMLSTLRAHALRAIGAAERASAATLKAEGGTDQTMAPRFVPMPERGPCKGLRKKLATFLEILLIQGPGGVLRVLREKSSDASC